MNVTNVTVGVQLITVAMAKEMLSRNTKNFRKPEHKRVTRYAKDMSDGRWQLTGETITFDLSGALIDGQHRLLAIVKSGVACWFIVVDGLQEKVAANVDRGISRTVAQWLIHLGIANATTAAAVGRMAVAHDLNLWKNQGFGAGDFTDSDIIEMVVNNNAGIQSSMIQSAAGLPRSIATTIAFLGSGRKGLASSPTCKWFFKSLQNGENIGETDAVFHLRRRLIEHSTTTKKLSPHMMRMLATLAWNKTVQGESVNILRIRLTGPSPEQLPNRVLVADDVV